MNLAWGLFIVEGTGNAAGGLASNILRAVCLIFAILFTVIYDKRNNKDALKFPVFNDELVKRELPRSGGFANSAEREPYDKSEFVTIKNR